MDFAVGENIEAVDECGVWHYAEIVDKREDSVIVTFPPWKPDWDREIFDASEIRKRTAEEVLVPRRFANNKSPNLKKLMAGDTVFLFGEGVIVQYSDPIRKLVTVKLHDATIQTVNVWELELTPRVAKKDSKVGRKRKRRNEDLATPNEIPPLQQPGPLPPAAESASLEFCVHVESSGTVIRVGSFYSLVFAGNSVFVCTGISRVSCQFTYKFVLCSLVNDKVDNLIQDVYCSVMDVKYVCNSDVTCTSKVRNLLDKIICEGWERVLRCQERNIGNMSYLLDLRKSCLASQMRQGVWSGISRSATRPSQPLHLGVFDPVLDTQIFGLSSTNNFQISYRGKDIAKLDSVGGSVGCQGFRAW